ncbi:MULTISPECIES: winged helix-turn-helix domain-containing protein [unclassified Streptomyces]
MKTLIGRLFHVSYTVEGTWRLLRRHGLVLAAAGPAGDRT